jgi:hypothetical protein
MELSLLHQRCFNIIASSSFWTFDHSSIDMLIEVFFTAWVWILWHSRHWGMEARFRVRVVRVGGSCGFNNEEPSMFESAIPKEVVFVALDISKGADDWVGRKEDWVGRKEDWVHAGAVRYSRPRLIDRNQRAFVKDWMT